jgi:twinkle protein
MAIFLNDSVDFSAYMEDTDAQHSIRNANDYLQDVIDYFHNPEKNKGDELPFKKTKSKLAFRKGEVTLWNGYNGHGKSLFLGQVCVGLCRQGKKVLIASMEMKVGTTLARMCRQEYTARPEIDAIRQFHAWTDGLLWFYDQQGTVKAEKMLAVCRYAIDVLKIDHIVIDSLLKLGIGEDDLNQQKHIVDQLTSIARDSNAHIHLVVHARKPKDEDELPNKYVIRGSGSIPDQADNIFHIWRNKPKERGAAEIDADTVLICDKQRNGEWEGQIYFWLHPETHAYLETDYF